MLEKRSFYPLLFLRVPCSHQHADTGAAALQELTPGCELQPFLLQLLVPAISTAPH